MVTQARRGRSSCSPSARCSPHVAMLSVFAVGSAMSSSSQRRPRATCDQDCAVLRAADRDACLNPFTPSERCRRTLWRSCCSSRKHISPCPGTGLNGPVLIPSDRRCRRIGLCSRIPARGLLSVRCTGCSSWCCWRASERPLLGLTQPTYDPRPKAAMYTWGPLALAAQVIIVRRH
jgi:hypothetical protein